MDYLVTPAVLPWLPQHARLALRASYLSGLPVDHEVRDVEALVRLRLPTDVGADRPDDPHAVLELAAYHQLYIDISSVDEMIPRQQVPGRQPGMDRCRRVHV